MDLTAATVPAHWAPTLWLLAAGLFAAIWRRADWTRLRRSADLNVLLGASVVVLGLWLIRTGIRPGLGFHLLGATVLTLMFGPWLALLGLSLVCAALAMHSGEWQAFPANLLIMGATPVVISWTIYRLVDRHLPNHLFIYIFANGFFGAALAVSAVGLVSTAFAALAGSYATEYLLRDYLPYYLLIAWAEALSSGMAVTLLVVYRPEWVSTFDDRRYLHSK